MSKLEDVKNAVIKGKAKGIDALVKEAIDEGNSPLDVLNNGLIGAMGVVGDKFAAGELFVPEMLISAKVMKKGVEVVKPLLGGDQSATIGKVVIGTVRGDLHDIGKNLVAMMIETNGFEVIDLGVDVSPEKFAETVKANPDAKIVGLSALLTTTMTAMKDTVDALKEAGVRDQVKVMVGGAPISQAFCDEVGADIYTEDAGAAAAAAKAAVK